MKIYDLEDNELQEEDIDLELGYLVEDRKFLRHHEGITPDPENDQWADVDPWDEYEWIQRYILYTEEELEHNRIEKEEKQKQEIFLKDGSSLLNNTVDNLNIVTKNLEETNLTIEDIILLLAEMLGTENEIEEEE